MNKFFSITTNNPALYDSLISNLPNGVQIISDRLTEMSNSNQLPLPFEFNTVIKITADLTIIHKYVLAIWLINTVRELEGKHKININDQNIAVTDPEPLGRLMSEIEYEV